MPKNNVWQPTASWTNLQRRAAILQQIREFFAERNVLEVQTPLLSQATVTDPHLASFETKGANQQTSFLQTSPEYAMKRLLAAGSGPIYQITQAFRAEEAGRLHNPEFTLLEWYQPEFDHHQLMDEMDELLQTVLQTQAAERLSYQQLFQHYLKLDPLHCTLTELQTCAAQHGLTEVQGLVEPDKDDWLQLLMSQFIEPQLNDTVYFIYDYPASQAALAKISSTNPLVAERFEVYVNGVELANGFHELTDADEQCQRFTADLAKRQKLGLPIVTIDQRLLAALQHGLPDCAGVALGIDRLIMLAVQVDHVEDAVAFPWERA